MCNKNELLRKYINKINLIISYMCMPKQKYDIQVSSCIISSLFGIVMLYFIFIVDRGKHS